MEHSVCPLSNSFCQRQEGLSQQFFGAVDNDLLRVCSDAGHPGSVFITDVLLNEFEDVLE